MERDESRLTVEVDAPRGATSREWELFARESPSEPLRHVGSVSAPTVDVARKQATSLFGDRIAALWICPADETRRFQSTELSLAADDDGTDATMDREEMAAETLRGANE